MQLLTWKPPLKFATGRDQFLDIDASIEAHRFDQEDTVFHVDVSRCSRSKWTSAQSSERRVEAGDPHVDRGGNVRQPQSAGIVEMCEHRFPTSEAQCLGENPADLRRIRISYRVGEDDFICSNRQQALDNLEYPLLRYGSLNRAAKRRSNSTDDFRRQIFFTALLSNPAEVLKRVLRAAMDIGLIVRLAGREHIIDLLDAGLECALRAFEVWDERGRHQTVYPDSFPRQSESVAELRYYGRRHKRCNLDFSDTGVHVVAAPF